MTTEKTSEWYHAELRRMRPVNVAAVIDFLGCPVTRGDECHRIAKLADGRYVWCTWGTPAYFWGPVNPADYGCDGDWQRVPADGEFCADTRSILTLSARYDASKPKSDFVTGDGRDGWCTVWAKRAQRIVREATPAEVAEAKKHDEVFA